MKTSKIAYHENCESRKSDKIISSVSCSQSTDIKLDHVDSETKYWNKFHTSNTALKMVGIAAGTLQAYALLVLMGLGNHITNPSDEFAKAELCNVDTSNKIKIDSVCAPTYVTVPLPEYDDNFQNMVPKHVVVKRCLGECFSQTDKKLQCSPTESGVVKRNVEV